ncbi:MAG: hypothetical protein U9N32_06385, partial [Spirochaetota bacterium]|nr:hypothetical protein [Spirochaetota bacterium]
MLKKQFLIGLIFSCVFISLSFAQSDISYSSVQVEVAPYMAFPLTEDIDYFGMSVGSQLKAGFTMPFIPALSLGPEAGYGINLLEGDSGDTLSTITAGVFARFSPYLAPWLTVNIFGNGGYYYSYLNNETDHSGSNPYVGGGIGLSVLFGKAKFFSVGLEGAYRNYLGFFQEIGVTASGTFHLGEKITPTNKTPLIIEQIEKPLITPLEFKNYSSEALFPTLLKYYNEHSFGSVEITNPNSFPLKDVSISFNMNKYMDNKKECISIPSIDGGETITVELYALFNSSILEIYEKTMVSAILKAEYAVENEVSITELPVTVDILDRNALIWDDDRRAAAFVTAKDPIIMKFAKNVISAVNISGAINTNLYRVIALFTALNKHGLIYSIDPASSYADFADNSMAIDYLQYPRQTLDYKSGDCDDLTVLNAALIESIGIPAAFITVPGHIFLAFSLDIPYEDAGRIFINQEDLID